MQAVARILPVKGAGYRLARLSLALGIFGMAASFSFLASAHPLDVMAGASGFIAGSILVAAGLVSISIEGLERLHDSVAGANALITKPPFAVGRWLAHFRRNHENRPEPGWCAPLTMPIAIVRSLVHSLEQFQLGDGGGPAYLIARDREQFLSTGEGTRELVDRWFDEEREHSRLLGCAVDRFGGQRINSHWSFTAFCLARQWFGIRFELTVLLLTEIASTVYYRLLRRHGKDPALSSMCRLIIRDEVGHVAFHRDRLTRAAPAQGNRYGKLWELRFRLLGLGAATMLWVNHAPALCALGATGREFYREVWLELSRFVSRLRRDVSSQSLDFANSARAHAERE